MIDLPDVIPAEDWKKYTASALVRRSVQLKKVDAAIQKYNAIRNVVTLLELMEAFDAWKASKGTGDEWKEGQRNKNQYVQLLDQQLSGVGDTDTALGMPGFMEPAMINARLGIVYLYANLRCDDLFKVALEGALDITTASLDFAATDANPNIERASSVLGKAKGTALDAAGAIEKKAADRIRSREGKLETVSSRVLLSGPIGEPPSRLRQVWNELREKLYAVAQKLWGMAQERWAAVREKLRQARANPGDAALEYSPSLMRKLVDLLVGKFLAAAAPFIGAGLDLAKGVANTIDASITKFREWSAAKSVELVIGHPGTIAEAIRRAMWVNVGKGLYDALKGAVKLGIEAGTQGAAAIVSLVWSIVEALGKTIWKLVEIAQMKAIFRQARDMWRFRDQAASLHFHPLQFNAWFKAHALLLPALPVLVLNSGIAGDKMHFMKMFKEDKSIVTQASFDAGCKYIDSLKVWGTQYLSDSGFGFHSDDGMVQGLLDRDVSSHSEDLSKGGQTWKWIRGFLNA